MKNIFSKFIYSFIIITFCGLFLSACNQDNHVIFQDIHGKQYPLKDYKGKWVIINYWASWCKPCYTEIPEINAFAKHYQNKSLVLGVSYDQENGEQLTKIIKQMKVAFPTLSFDPAQELGIDNIQGLPATILINPQGKLVKTLYGMQTQQSLALATGLG